MKTFYKQTKKGAIVECNLIGTNPNKPNESIWVFFKKETSGKYTVEIHSNDRATDMSWDKSNKPWSDIQLLAASLYGAKPSYSNVLRFKTDYGTNVNEATKALKDLVMIAKKLTQLK